MKTGRRLRVKLYVMTCSHWLSASNRFITPYTHRAFYNIFCHFFNKVQQERWYYRWHDTKKSEYSLHTSTYHYQLQCNFVVKVELSSDISLELSMKNIEGGRREGEYWRKLEDFCWPTQILIFLLKSRQQTDSDISGFLSYVCDNFLDGLLRPCNLSGQNLVKPLSMILV